MTNAILHKIAKNIPGLYFKLKQARLNYKPEDFVKKTILSSVYMGFGIFLLIFFTLSKTEVPMLFIILSFPICVVLMFFYMVKLPEMKVIKMSKEVNREIVFLIRFLVIEIKSGVPLYNAIENIDNNFKVINKYTNEIIQKVQMGTTLADAIQEGVNTVPSNNLRKLFWQMLNSLQTGADVSESMKALLEQVEREQQIAVKEYGRKLNPLAMFYMMLAVIIPSLGVTMLIVFATFIGIELNLLLMMIIAGFLGFMQFMFYNIIKTQRPSVDI